jgi:hypothetical protein
MHSSSSISRRVASRFLRSEVVLREEPHTRVVFSDGGLVTSNEIAALLQPQYGSLQSIEFIGAPPKLRESVTWLAADAAGREFYGSLLLRCSLSPDRFNLWVEVEPAGYCSVPPQERLAGAPRQLLDDRLQLVAARLRRLLQETRVRPDVPAHTFAADLAEVLTIVEAGSGPPPIS